MSGTCKAESRESRRDGITAGALKLGALLADVESYDPVAAQVGYAAALARGNRIAAAAMAFAQPIVAALDRLTREAGEREAAKAGVSPNDAARIERERCASVCESMVIGGRAWTKEQAIAADALFAAAKNIRGDGGKPEGVASGDCFRWIGGAYDGEVGEVTAGPVVDDDGAKRWKLTTRGDWAHYSEPLLLDPKCWTRVRAVEQVSAPDDGQCKARSFSGDACKLATGHAAVHEGPRGTFDAVLAAPAVRSVGGHEMAERTSDGGPGWLPPVDDDLDGPAGDERIGLTDSAQALADMTAQRDALLVDVEKLRSAHHD